MRDGIAPDNRSDEKDEKNAPSNMTDMRLRKITQLQMKICLRREAVICEATVPNVRPIKIPGRNEDNSMDSPLCASGSAVPGTGAMRPAMSNASA